MGLKEEQMQDPLDLELQNDAAPPPPYGPRRRPLVWAALLLIAAIVAVGGYWYYQRGVAPALPAPSSVSAPAAEPPSDTSLGAAAEPIEIPPLDMSDDTVRMLVSALSSHPTVAAWLTTDDLIRNFTVSVENVANGVSPAGHLQVLRPSAPFQRTERGERLFVDPSSYDRYSSLAEAVASIDAVGAARLYSNLKPRIEEAYRELGASQPFDRTLERALVSLLSVPDVEGDIELQPQGAVYQFANPRLEGLTPAQKQLLRMGPRNMRTIQGRLRDIALALGIPPTRLP